MKFKLLILSLIGLGVTLSAQENTIGVREANDPSERFLLWKRPSYQENCRRRTCIADGTAIRTFLYSRMANSYPSILTADLSPHTDHHVNRIVSILKAEVYTTIPAKE